jgi:hypothetical protein
MDRVEDHYVEWNKWGRERQVWHDFTHRWVLTKLIAKKLRVGISGWGVCRNFVNGYEVIVSRSKIFWGVIA